MFCVCKSILPWCALMVKHVRALRAIQNTRTQGFKT